MSRDRKLDSLTKELYQHMSDMQKIINGINSSLDKNSKNLTREEREGMEITATTVVKIMREDIAKTISRKYKDELYPKEGEGE